MNKPNSINSAHNAAFVLADGTPLASLIDRQKREISLRMMSDPEIYELELQKLWAKAWVLVGHESEIPKEGDFVSRKVGEDKVVVVRQKDGSIACLLNACPHRGMQVCRANTGSTTVFKCIYHGWAFNLDGSFRGAPFNDEMYPNGFDRDARKLVAARVELFGGLIFVNWDEKAPSLDDYLGDIRFYMRKVFDRTTNGFEVLGAPQRYVINANWKTAAEQAVGDGYHGATLHRSLVDMGAFGKRANDSRSWGLFNHKVNSNGHGLICHDLRSQYAGMIHDSGVEMTALERLRVQPPAGMPPELVEDFASRFSEEELRAFADVRPGVGLLFPNIHFIAFAVPDPEGGHSSAFGVHTFVPRGPNQFEFIHWNFVERGASDAFKEKLLRTSVFTTGAAGIIEQDDSLVWSGVQESARGYIARSKTLKYHATSEPQKPEGWLGEGNVYSGFSSDDNQWNWWNVYFDYLLDNKQQAVQP